MWGHRPSGPKGTWDPSLVPSGEGHPKGSWHLLYGGDRVSLAGPSLLRCHVVPLEHQVPVKTCQPHKGNSVLTRVDVCSMTRTDVCSQHQCSSQLKNTGYLHKTQQKTQQNRTEKLWWGESEWRTAGQREGAQRSFFPKTEKFSQNRKCGPGVSKMRMRTNKCEMRREEGSVW